MGEIVELDDGEKASETQRCEDESETQNLGDLLAEIGDFDCESLDAVEAVREVRERYR